MYTDINCQCATRSRYKLIARIYSTYIAIIIVIHTRVLPKLQNIMTYIWIIQFHNLRTARVPSVSSSGAIHPSVPATADNAVKDSRPIPNFRQRPKSDIIARIEQFDVGIDSRTFRGLISLCTAGR